MQLLLTTLIVTGFLGAPNTSHLPAVTGFDIIRYTGVWYEIARLPHRFEKNLASVTATYTIRDDESIWVENRGFNTVKNKWSSVRGRGYFKGAHDVGLLKVSFFRPFYGEYKIILLDRENYNWSVVTSSSYKYLWILARSPTLEPDTLKVLLEFVEKSGFDMSRIEMVEQMTGIQDTESK